MKKSKLSERQRAQGRLPRGWKIRLPRGSWKPHFFYNEYRWCVYFPAQGYWDKPEVWKGAWRWMINRNTDLNRAARAAVSHVKPVSWEQSP